MYLFISLIVFVTIFAYLSVSVYLCRCHFYSPLSVCFAPPFSHFLPEFSRSTETSQVESHLRLLLPFDTSRRAQVGTVDTPARSSVWGGVSLLTVALKKLRTRLSCLLKKLTRLRRCDQRAMSTKIVSRWGR